MSPHGRGPLPAAPWPALGDLLAGVSVAVILIPQSMAYAQLAGLPAHIGLFAAMLPPMAAALFASSPYLQTGPVAMTSLLTLGVLTPLAAPGSPEFIGLAALLALVVGVVRLTLGLARGGFLAYFMSQPVLAGFATAAALLITFSQVPAALGIAVEHRGLVGGALWALSHPGGWEPASVAIAALTAGVVLVGRRIHPLMPGVLLAVVGALAFSMLTGYDGAVVGEVTLGIPAHAGNFPWAKLPALILPGGIIALVGFAEPAAIARSFAEQDRQPWSPNREFVSQGVANLAAGVSGAFPVGGSFSRSSIARVAGARSRWAGAITGFAVLAFLPFASILAPLPQAVLAGIVIAAVFELIRLKPLLAMVRGSRVQAGIGWITFTLTLAMAPRIDLALLTGVGLAVVIHLWRELLIQVQVQLEGDTLRIEPIGVLFFASAPPLDAAIVQHLAEHPSASHLVLDLNKLGRIDYTGALVLRRVAAEAQKAGLTVHIVGAPPQAQRVLRNVLGADSPLLRAPDA